MGLFDNREGRIPVWFMRQAGRYHRHYQEIKKTSDFISMCKTPDLACEITMGPVRAFGFDGAILFSDLLFPLEQLGMGLSYNPGPQLGWHLQSAQDLRRLKVIAKAQQFYHFQALALQRLKEVLPDKTTLLGFTGAPWTLYTYAVSGGHKGELTSAKLGLTDGRWEGLMEVLLPQLMAQMKIQSAADGMCLFDTAAGELSVADYRRFVVPVLRRLCAEFKRTSPGKKLIYYSKHTHLKHLQCLECDAIDVLGIDWRMDLSSALDSLGGDYLIQGNLDPSHLHLPWELLRRHWDELWESVKRAKTSPGRWICGLGHGVLQRTPEDNVARSVEHIHRHFRH